MTNRGFPCPGELGGRAGEMSPLGGMVTAATRFLRFFSEIAVVLLPVTDAGGQPSLSLRFAGRDSTTSILSTCACFWTEPGRTNDDRVSLPWSLRSLRRSDELGGGERTGDTLRRAGSAACRQLRLRSFM